MGRGGFNLPNRGMPMPVVPTENKGIMSGPIRKLRRQGRRMRPRGSRPDIQLGRVTQPDGSTLITYGSSPRSKERGGSIGRRPFVMLPPKETSKGPYPDDPVVRPLTGGYNPESGVRYTDTGIPTAVQQTRRVAVQDPTLGGAPEREVPIARERRQRITRESDPRGPAPFSPDERGMARDRFFERMFDRADEAKQQRSMEREERDNVRDALRSEKGIRESEMAGPGDERQGGRDEGGRGRVRRGRVFSGGLRERCFFFRL